MDYFKTNQKTIEFKDELISKAYSEGYLLTRLGKGIVNQTRSLRINLKFFQLNSENKRVLKKFQELQIDFQTLPLKNYSWEIHKLGKDFYSSKFGDGTMSAAKIKELFNDQDKSNVNSVFIYSLNNKTIGYCLCYVNNEILHYAYPFYDLNISSDKNLGMNMMLNAIIFAKEKNLDYVYLGSVVDSKSKYKLQFKGLEWWNETSWDNNLDLLKSKLYDSSIVK